MAISWINAQAGPRVRFTSAAPNSPVNWCFFGGPGWFRTSDLVKLDELDPS
jgi:hypothetical protein